MTKHAMIGYLLTAVLILQTCCVVAGQSIKESLPDGVNPETGYRMERYRAPVPNTLPGGTVINALQIKQSLNAGLVLIDVYPPRGLGPDPLNGQWLINEEHENISNSVWLPEIGRGYLDSDYEAYFRRNLTQLTNDSLDTPLVFYCTADCWQSWNAARRAIVWGYREVFWYPEGIDGWLDAGFDLAPALPINFLGE